MTSFTFRFDLGADCLNFIATVGARHSDAPVERMPTPASAMEWTRASGLLDRGDQLMPFETTDLLALVNLRELLHRLVHDFVGGRRLRSDDIDTLNTLARDLPSPSVTLARSGATREWTLVSNRQLNARHIAALLAADAIRLLGGERRTLLKQCEGSTCDGIYLDTTRAFNRRWCSSVSCGNSARVAKHRLLNVPAPLLR